MKTKTPPIPTSPSKMLASKDLLTTEDMMSLLDCGRTTIHNHLKAGVLPIKPFKVANRCYWRAEAVNAWLAILAADGEAAVQEVL